MIATGEYTQAGSQETQGSELGLDFLGFAGWSDLRQLVPQAGSRISSVAIGTAGSRFLTQRFLNEDMLASVDPNQ